VQDAAAPADDDSAPVPATDDADLDFSSLKKKKKSKKAALDMEAFEKELHDAKAKDGDDDDEADGEVVQEDIEIEGDIGDDVFAMGEAPQGLESGSEPWLSSDRDYIYPEVRSGDRQTLH
jgi:translation initiation factor 2 subunit 2